MAIADEKYVVVTVDDVSTKARVVQLSDDRLGLWTTGDIVTDGQAVTLRADRADSPGLTATAQVVRSGRAFDETRAKIRRKYGHRSRPSHIESVVLVRPE